MVSAKYLHAMERRGLTVINAEAIYAELDALAWLPDLDVSTDGDYDWPNITDDWGI